MKGMKIILPNAKELNTNMDPQAFQIYLQKVCKVLSELGSKILSS